MIALKDWLNQDTMVTGELNRGTCFRLVFGAATKSDGVTDKSIKFINTVTIVMKGAPSSSHGKEEKSDEPKQTATAGKSKTSGGSGGTGVSGDGNGGGSGSGKSKGPALASGTSGDGGKVSSVSVANTDAQGEEAPWRIFEMMNKSESNLPLRFLNNPLAPYLWPAFGILLIMAATSRYALFRRRLA